jgi:hypothetical protein
MTRKPKEDEPWVRNILDKKREDPSYLLGTYTERLRAKCREQKVLGRSLPIYVSKGCWIFDHFPEMYFRRKAEYESCELLIERDEEGITVRVKHITPLEPVKASRTTRTRQRTPNLSYC